MQRNKPVLIAAVILGLLAIGLTVMSLVGGGGGQQPPVAAAPTPAPKTTQVVAIREIPPRTLITRNLVREEETTEAQAGAPLALEAVLNKLSGTAIPQGKMITAEDLVDPIKRTSLANFAIPAGTRAVAVMIDKTQTMGDIVDVGDRVDVVVVHKLTTKDPVTEQNSEFRSGRTIAQNLLVLATDPALKQVPTPAPAQPAQPGQPPAPPPTPTPPPPPPAPGQPIPKLRVVLAAPAAEAERIAAAQIDGLIHLTLRDPNSAEEVPVPEAFEYPVVRMAARSKKPAGNAAPSKPSMPQNWGMPEPPKFNNVTPMTPPDAGPVGNEVTVIRGTEKTRVIVPQN